MAAIVATILVATAVGMWAEERYGGRARIAARRGLIFVLYFVLPPVTFFNLARADIDRIMEGVPRLHRSPGRGLRVVAAKDQQG